MTQMHLFVFNILLAFFIVYMTAWAIWDYLDRDRKEKLQAERDAELAARPTLQSMLDKVAVLANEMDERYFEVRVHLNTVTGLEVGAYINRLTWVTGKTIDECVVKLREYRGEYKKDSSPIVDVII